MIHNGYNHNVYNQSALQIPWCVILGNHDYHRNPQAQIDYGNHHVDGRWNMPDHEYIKVFTFNSSSDSNSNSNNDSSSTDENVCGPSKPCTLQIVFIDTPILAPNETIQIITRSISNSNMVDSCRTLYNIFSCRSRR
jgi:hypothetical protein